LSFPTQKGKTRLWREIEVSEREEEILCESEGYEDEEESKGRQRDQRRGFSRQAPLKQLSLAFAR